MPLPAIAIIAAAIPRLTSGSAFESAFPATAYMDTDTPLSPTDYRRVALILSHTVSTDGETEIIRAEAMANAGSPEDQTIPIVENALTHTPASARGWILLARLLADRDPKRGADALALAIQLAPHEYFLVTRRAYAGAALWANLSEDIHNILLNDARLMIDTQRFHFQLLLLLQTPGGQALLTRVLANDPDKVRDLSQRLLQERLNNLR